MGQKIEMAKTTILVINPSFLSSETMLIDGEIIPDKIVHQVYEMSKIGERMSKIYSYGVALDITRFTEEFPGPYTADILITYKDQQKEFSYDEFLRILGFELEEK